VRQSAWTDAILKRGWLPDGMIRAGIRWQLGQRLRQERRRADAQCAEFIEGLRRGPIARDTAAANSQHYEVPVEFFEIVLGRYRKYSCGQWQKGAPTLEAAERAMLETTLERAGIQDGHRVLDLGCGWGSLSLYLAEALPRSDITAVSNSGPQIDFIRRHAAERGLENLTAIRADINEFQPQGRFDRIASIEMFEHMSNFDELLRRIAAWLEPSGFLFVHHFAHRDLAYPFMGGNSNEWMARHFFTGGVMPSVDFLARFDANLRVAQRWEVNGKHYQKTCEAWLAAMDARRDEVIEIFGRTYGAAAARKHYFNWRIFFMACAELFGYRGGDEWLVVHSLLQRAD
jgi:cyclopropane-fatty-acyl-phospholipid synthase